ncbi:MAG TPA: hypothetical protein VHZ31_04045 [Solirubrobacteraceae bacterium]|jgi:hypothetical protein|nr:hypothetical protein [Solirubrobacteraceae bacterium]
MNRRAISTVLLAGCALAATAAPSTAQTSTPTPPPTATPPLCFPGNPPKCFQIPELPKCDADGNPSDTGEYPCTPPTPPPPPPPPPAAATSTPPAATPPPPPPPPAPAAAAAIGRNADVGLKAGKRFAVDSDGHLTVGTVTCPIAASFCPFVTSRLAVPGHATDPSYAKRTLRLVPGQGVTLGFTLIQTARRKLRRNGSLQAQIVVRSGTAAAVTRMVTLHR